MKKKYIRLTIDIAMTVLLPVLMAYSLIGEKLHEVIGSAMLLLFILHHILNRKWYPALFKGKYSARRIFQTVLDILLLVIMIMQPVSGILMSKHLYTFIRIQGVSATTRELHMCLAYWEFALICVHAGMHLTAPVGRVMKSRKATGIIIHVFWLVASVYGIIAFVRRNIADYMFRKIAFAFFDYSEPMLYFLMDYVAMMFLFMLIGHILSMMFSKFDNAKRSSAGE